MGDSRGSTVDSQMPEEDCIHTNCSPRYKDVYRLLISIGIGRSEEMDTYSFRRVKFNACGFVDIRIVFDCMLRIDDLRLYRHFYSSNVAGGRLSEHIFCRMCKQIVLAGRSVGMKIPGDAEDLSEL